jgi:surface polysaccharide O-acyltransferase-like enzyme
MQELLLNQWLNYSILLLNAIVAGQVLWFSINIKKSKILQYAIFTVGIAYAVSIGGLFKAPGFIINPEVEVFWLFLNALIGIFIIYSFLRSSALPMLVSNAAIVLSLIGATTVFGGIQEFGMRYMPTILFFTICIYSGVGLIIYQVKVATMQKMQKRLSYVAAGLVFTVVCLSAFDTYTLVRDTAYTGVSEGWEGGVTEQQDELSN